MIFYNLGPTIVDILTFMSRKNRILGLPVLEKTEFLDVFLMYGHLKFHVQLS